MSALFGPPDIEKLAGEGDVSRLIKALSYGGDAGVRDAAAKALGKIGLPAVGLLIARMKRGWSEYLADAFYEIGSPAVEPLIAVLKQEDQSDRVCEAVQNALVAVGIPALKPLVPLMDEIKQGRSHSGYYYALRAIEEIKKETCKAFRGERCVVQGRDTGPCTWRPSRWQNCSVVIENTRSYGKWEP
jgi:HEAT repeat protein